MVATVEVQAAWSLLAADIQLIAIQHAAPDAYSFRPDGVWWIDLCLTPRRPLAKARFINRWGVHRYGSMGAIMALPPDSDLHLRNEGGEHVSLICAIQADYVGRWLPQGFTWTDRRLEACLDISNANVREVMVRLSREVRQPSHGKRQLGDALVVQLSIELARYLIAVDEPAELGGIAPWRLRVIDLRLEEAGKRPTLDELADLCGLSTRQLTRGFRASRGCSIGDYIRESRIIAAKRLLAGDLSIKAIADITGFASQSTFTYAFHTMAGVTPSEFRYRIVRRLGTTAAADGDAGEIGGEVTRRTIEAPAAYLAEHLRDAGRPS